MLAIPNASAMLPAERTTNSRSRLWRKTSSGGRRLSEHDTIVIGGFCESSRRLRPVNVIVPVRKTSFPWTKSVHSWSAGSRTGGTGWIEAQPARNTNRNQVAWRRATCITPSFNRWGRKDDMRSSVAHQLPRRLLDLLFAHQELFLQRRRVRDGGVEGAEDADGGVEVVERLFLDDGGDRLADRAGAGVLVDDEDTVAAAGEGEDRFAVEGSERAEI